MFKYLKTKQIKGFTLVELMATVLISATFFAGLLLTYSQGARAFNMMLSEYRMYEETSWFFDQMRVAVEMAESASIIAGRLTLTHPKGVFSGDQLSGRIQIFFNPRDHTIRMHDYRVGVNNANKRILPRFNGNPIGHVDGQSRQLPFEVDEVNFSFYDDLHRFIKIEVKVVNEYELPDETIELKQDMSMIYCMFNSLN